MLTVPLQIYFVSRDGKHSLTGPLLVRKCDISKKWKLYRKRGEVSANVLELGCNIFYKRKMDAIADCKMFNERFVKC